jgi:transposase InsO family protein
MEKKVIDRVLVIRSEMPRIGTRKLYHLLHSPLREVGVGRDKLFAILRAHGMLIAPKRNRRITTQSRHPFRKYRNLISELSITRPEQIWASDITYIGALKNHCYLSLVTDVYSKKIMGYDLSSSLSTESPLRALQMAVKNRLYPEEALIHHSDRGLQYCSHKYQETLAGNRIEPSMTESHDPYANAVAERVNGILKQEFLLEEAEVSRHILKKLVKDSIRIYNNKRPHTSCGMNTPEWMHGQRDVEIKTYKKVSESQSQAYACDWDSLCDVMK